jgi:hypothetical protein
MFCITKVKLHLTDDNLTAVVVSNPDYCKIVFEGEHLPAMRLYEAIVEKITEADDKHGMLVF